MSKISNNLTHLSTGDNKCKMVNFFLLEELVVFFKEKHRIFFDKNLIEQPFLHAHAEMLFGSDMSCQEKYHQNLKYPFRHHIRSTGYNILSFCKKVENTKDSVLLFDVFNELQRPQTPKPEFSRLLSASAGPSMASAFPGLP